MLKSMLVFVSFGVNETEQLAGILIIAQYRGFVLGEDRHRSSRRLDFFNSELLLRIRYRPYPLHHYSEHSLRTR